MSSNGSGFEPVECEGCGNACARDCGSVCASDCSGQCTTSCTGDCKGSCELTCTGCGADCAFTCNDVCSDSCMNNCDTACTTYCSAICGSGCSSNCYHACTQTCLNTCEGTCSHTCVGGCEHTASAMTVDAANNLLAAIKKEIYRRSGMDENGEPLLDEQYRHFNQPILSAPDDSLFTLGYTDDVIRALNGVPIVNTLINIMDYKDLRSVHEYDPIPGAFDADTLKAMLDQLRSEWFNSPKSSCRSACTGLCVSNCTESCTGGCVLSCSACTTLCMNGCEVSCTGCAKSCGVTCGIACGSSCAAESVSCAGCSAGCSGCTGCSDTCEGTCTGCSYTCQTECTGGTSSYKAAGVTGSTITSKKIPTITFYHNGGVYAVTKGVKKNNVYKFTIPSYGYDTLNPYFIAELTLGSYATNGSARPQYWVDEQHNWFKSGDTVYYAETEKLYNSNKALGRLTTMSLNFKSYIFLQQASLYKYHVDVKPTFVTEVFDRWYDIHEASWVMITAHKGSTELKGFAEDEYGIFIHNEYKPLPFIGVIDAHTVIDVVQNPNVTYSIKRVVIDNLVNATIYLPNDKIDCVKYGRCGYYDIDVDVENEKFTYNLISEKDCDTDNEYARASHLGIQNKTQDIYSVRVKNHLMLGADKRYHGYLYSVDIDVYGPCNEYDGKQYYPSSIRGDSSPLLGQAVFTDIRQHNYAPHQSVTFMEVPINEQEGSTYKYQFTVPETNDIGAIAYTNEPSNKSPYSVRFLPGHTYTITKNQSVVLRPLLG